MALSSALFSGISGLSTLGNSMQIIGDNIANVNTVAFKGSTFAFQDLLSQSIFTRSGSSQVGRGTALGDINVSYEQGSFEATGSTTDLAIGGDGFFVVREPGSESLFYTRAGNFQYDKDGYLTNPEGYIVQGWVLDAEGENTGSVTDVVLTSFTSSPDDSNTLTVITNLDSDATANGATDLYTRWDASSSTNIAGTDYEYQSTVKIYDALGSTHDVTVYFTRDAGSVWEYIVTCNPDEDLRTGAVVAGTPTAGAGLLAAGNITFSDSSGTITTTGLTMRRFDGSAAGGDWTNLPDTDNWTTLTTADLTNDGYYEFLPQFINGVTQNVRLDVGTAHDGSTFVNNSLTTTQYARASTTTFQATDGYGAGDLQGVDVDVDGVITGIYSNGQVTSLNRVALAKFTSMQGLHKEGGNLYRETRESGDPITNMPGTNGLGNIAPNSLEQSNVDIAAEFVRMITTQRGFQANSKVITVTDQMLAELINLKR